MCVDEEERKKKKSMCVREREREAIDDNDECLKENPTTHLLNFLPPFKTNSIVSGISSSFPDRNI